MNNLEKLVYEQNLVEYLIDKKYLHRDKLEKYNAVRWLIKGERYLFINLENFNGLIFKESSIPDFYELKKYEHK
jgi:hypothetical protein